MTKQKLRFVKKHPKFGNQKAQISMPIRVGVRRRTPLAGGALGVDSLQSPGLQEELAQGGDQLHGVRDLQAGERPDRPRAPGGWGQRRGSPGLPSE